MSHPSRLCCAIVAALLFFAAAQITPAQSNPADGKGRTGTSLAKTPTEDKPLAPQVSGNLIISEFRLRGPIGAKTSSSKSTTTPAPTTPWRAAAPATPSRPRTARPAASSRTGR